MNKLLKIQRNAMLARRIREVRQEKGLTGFDLAKVIGCTQGIISQYETEHADPPLETLIKICDAIGCSLDYLLGREIDYNPTSPRGRILGAFERLSVEQQNMMINMIEAVV